jgi:nucleoside-diphosphate-sugar epimerase
VEHGSATIIGRMMNFATFLAAPKACLGVVDVRDVARAHLLALTNSNTDGERILITHEKPVWFKDMRNWLMEEFKGHGELGKGFFDQFLFQAMSSLLLPLLIGWSSYMQRLVWINKALLSFIA